MNRLGFEFRVRLVGDVVLSRSARTSGSHESLRWIPGAALLGLAAQRLYERLDPAAAFRLFHSGAIRFEDALIETADGVAGLPAPLTWLKPKREGYGHRLERGALRDLAWPEVDPHDPFQGGIQGEQVRDRFVTSDRRWIDVATGRMTKSAIDGGGFGRTAEGALFAHEHLCAGQTFRGAVTCDEADAELAKRAFDELCARHVAFLGRSRAAQYGQVTIEPLADSPSQPTVPTPAGKDRIVFHLLSDVALRDGRTGAPTLCPAAELFGLPGRFDWCIAHSAIQTRRWSPFNGQRRSPDLERIVLSRGSVLVFTAPGQPLADAEAGALAAAVAPGLGGWLQDGLGRVVIEPLLAGRAADPWELMGPPPPLPVALVRRANAPQDLLFKVLTRRAEESARDHVAERLAATWLHEMEDQYGRLQAEYGQPLGPSRSQWGTIRDLAIKANGNLAALRRATVEGKEGFCRRGVSTAAWGKETWIRSGDGLLAVTFLCLLTKWLNAADDGTEPAAVAGALALVASRATSLAIVPEEGAKE